MLDNGKGQGYRLASGVVMDKDLLFKNLNEGILEEKGRAFISNLEKNRPIIGRHGGLSKVVGRFAHKHVVVIGAGPSLDGNMQSLKGIAKRQDVLLVATDMALRPLLLNGISPGFVITCETTPVDFFSGFDTSSLHLLVFACSFHGNVQRWQGGMSFYNWMMDGDFFTRLQESAGRGLGSVATGSIVTTQAVSIALGCPVKSLVLVGNDLAFTDRYYACGTVSGEKLFRLSNRLTSVENLHAGQINRAREYEIRRGDRSFYTNNQFLGAKMWLEDIFSRSSVPVIDCSVPGCSGKFVIKMEFDDFIKNLTVKKRRRR